ncbi:hypothetical protein C0991_002893 [Blastosporella zonata]|nr:hypothetical protein C0991_002893 [Blastosporella zonata]
MVRRSPSPGPYVPNPESLILPDGPVGEQAAELLEEFVHPQHHGEEVDVDADYHLRCVHNINLPWWKRPSPWWLLAVIPFTAIAMSATMAPRIEIYTLIVCSVLKPDIFHRTLPVVGGDTFNPPALLPALPPIISTFGNSTLGLHVSRGLAFNTTLFDNSINSSGTCASDPVVQAAVAKLAAEISSASPEDIGSFFSALSSKVPWEVRISVRGSKK